VVAAVVRRSGFGVDCGGRGRGGFLNRHVEQFDKTFYTNGTGDYEGQQAEAKTSAMAHN